MQSTDTTRRTPGTLTPEELDRLWTVDQLASRLHVKPATIYSWCHRGTIPFFRLGRKSLFDPHEIARWLSSKHVDAVGGES